MAAEPFLSEPPTSSVRVLSNDAAIPIVLACTLCEVTWRDVLGAPCWFCGRTGAVAHPERLVLD